MLSSTQRSRLLLIIAATVSFTLFWAAGRTFNIPYHFKHEASLVQHPAPVVAIFVTAVMLLVCTPVGTLIAGTVRFDAGLFGATIGLAALSLRGGAMHDVLLAARGPGIYLLLFIEMLILFGVVGLAWSGLWLLHRRGWLKADEFRDGVEDQQDPLTSKLLALITHTVVMMLSMLFLAQSDAKLQALAAVGISSFLASLASHYTYPVQPSVWFWAGAGLTGAVGYVVAYWDPRGLEIGLVQGYLAPLARPLPVDYAALGPAGAILGYWTSRRWQRAREDAAEKPAAGPRKGVAPR